VLQSVDFSEIFQKQLGLPAGSVAAQLSSPKAAGVRALLAQQLVHRWLQQKPAVTNSSNSSMWDFASSGSRAAAARGVQNFTGLAASSAPEAATATAASAGWVLGPGVGADSSGSDKFDRGRVAKLGWWVLLVQAGVSGLRLVWQLGCLTAQLLFVRAVVWVRQRLKQLLSATGRPL
jgi:hypothetical protein